MLRLTSILIAALCLSFFSCGSTGSQGGPSPLNSGTIDDLAPLSFRMHDYRSSQTMTIVSDAWLRSKGLQGSDFTHRRAAFYAQKRSGDDLMVKVVNDAVSNGIWQMLNQTKFVQMAQQGPAPEGGDAVQVFEVITADGPVHMVAKHGMPRKEGDVLRKTVRAFMDVYNNVMQLQAAQDRPTFKGAIRDN